MSENIVIKVVVPLVATVKSATIMTENACPKGFAKGRSEVAFLAYDVFTVVRLIPELHLSFPFRLEINELLVEVRLYKKGFALLKEDKAFEKREG